MANKSYVASLTQADTSPSIGSDMETIKEEFADDLQLVVQELKNLCEILAIGLDVDPEDLEGLEEGEA